MSLTEISAEGLATLQGSSFPKQRLKGPVGFHPVALPSQPTSTQVALAGTKRELEGHDLGLKCFDPEVSFVLSPLDRTSPMTPSKGKGAGGERGSRVSNGASAPISSFLHLFA